MNVFVPVAFSNGIKKKKMSDYLLCYIKVVILFKDIIIYIEI